MIVVTSLNPFENESPEVLQQLFQVTEECQTKLVLDFSDYFDISSQPKFNAALVLLASKELPQHVTLMCGLVKNKVYSDLHMCFMVSENPKWLETMIASAELSYSRTPLLTQEYYNKIFEDSVNLFTWRKHGDGSPGSRQVFLSEGFLDEITESSRRAFSHPAISRCI